MPAIFSRGVFNACFEANEEVAGAISTTAVGKGLISLSSPPVVKIIHPFNYVIAKKTSGIILFADMVNNLLEY